MYQVSSKSSTGSVDKIGDTNTDTQTSTVSMVISVAYFFPYERKAG